MKTERIINKQAREILSKGNLPSSVGVTTVLFSAVMTCIYLASLLAETLDFALESLGITLLSDLPLCFSALFVLFTVTALLFALPLFMGSVRFYYHLAKNEEGRFADLFHYLQKGKFFPSMGKMLRLLSKNFWKAVVSFLPGVLILLTASSAAASKENLDFYNILWYSISYAIIIGGIYLFCFLTAGKFLSLYLMIDNEDLPAKDALKFSEYAMHGFEKSAHRILFLYLPFLVLCLAVIPLLFVIPYIMTSYAVSAKWIIQLPRKQNEDW